MEKIFYFECECGGEAIHTVWDFTDEENKFNVSSLGQSAFVCQECGKTYYCGDWDEFCWDEEDL